jgi:hypothetical protein
MKISPRNDPIFACQPHARRGERGFVVIALMVILSIMLIYINVNMRLLANLKRELKLVEQAQIQRLERAGVQPLPLTNTASNALLNSGAP